MAKAISGFVRMRSCGNKACAAEKSDNANKMNIGATTNSRLRFLHVQELSISCRVNVVMRL